MIYLLYPARWPSAIRHRPFPTETYKRQSQGDVRFDARMPAAKLPCELPGVRSLIGVARVMVRPRQRQPSCPGSKATSSNSAEPAPDQKREHRSIALTARIRTCTIQQPFPLLGGEPVADAYAQPADPFTRRMPAASSGLNKPESAAAYAILRTAARRRLMVDGAYRRCSRLIL
jgi:hypothetical protein